MKTSENPTKEKRKKKKKTLERQRERVCVEANGIYPIALLGGSRVYLNSPLSLPSLLFHLSHQNQNQNQRKKLGPLDPKIQQIFIPK